eukprot:TRINITY_DN70071_c0_g1_i1.p2 TRINITY_DN70071_c0_g1~~TRINITY_DN70071_c0_g1_i1.p2  ORF type:complete len:186 (+),score=23.61 TRINITY_DN70071_c0_g1_i1:83-640(+)
MTFDPYAVLGVPQDATTEDIEAAFRRRALELHPDKNKGMTSPAFLLLAPAREALVCPSTRRAVDSSLSSIVTADAADERRQWFEFCEQALKPDTASQATHPSDANAATSIALLSFESDCRCGGVFTVTVPVVPVPQRSADGAAGSDDASKPDGTSASSPGAVEYVTTCCWCSLVVAVVGPEFIVR